MKINAALSISRDSSDKIRISVTCNSSKVNFLSIEIDPAEFCKALTGLAFVGCDGEVRGLDLVGKSRSTKTVEFRMPEHNYENAKEVASKELSRILAEDGDGWAPRDSFSSQSSFFSIGEERFARGLAVKYE